MTSLKARDGEKRGARFPSFLLCFFHQDFYSHSFLIPISPIHRLLLSDLPDIVISTPSKALQHLQSNSLSLTSLQSLVIDEADLILSFGYSNDITTLLSSSNLSKNYQSFLMSATLSSQVTSLKSLFLKKDPIVLDLKDGDLHRQNLSQYFVYLSEEDKFLLIYVLLKLKLIRGKSIIFLNSIDRGFRLKLFLEQFGLKSCLLNSELPANSRFHIVQEFNKGVYDYIIATDEVDLGQVERDENEDQDEEEEEEGEAENEDDKELDKEEDDDDDDEEEETVEEEGGESIAKRWKFWLNVCLTHLLDSLTLCILQPSLNLSSVRDRLKKHRNHQRRYLRNPNRKRTTNMEFQEESIS